MSAISGSEMISTCVGEAGKSLVAQYPDNVTFIDRNTVNAWGIEISADNIHPSDKGYDTLTTEIAAFLKKLFAN